ncbi:hypothetical protein EHP00_1666 [Ecytonucleospora hepatopenaei]|uniref:Uncharacterized protein n=1 Tax=Ecytonucleospora hepatopenaei TaxID=646526 RepID=A0A1W0E2Z9_9MICR|nr:hypothetical protein EHP00_1666 [Ecytonucleospora hepatopenaei]
MLNFPMSKKTKTKEGLSVTRTYKKGKCTKTPYITTKFTFIDTINLILIRHSKKYKEMFAKVEEYKTETKDNFKLTNNSFSSDESEIANKENIKGKKYIESSEDFSKVKYKTVVEEIWTDLVEEFTENYFEGLNLNNKYYIYKGDKEQNVSNTKYTCNDPALLDENNIINQITASSAANKYYSLNRKYVEEIEKIALTNKESKWVYFDIFDKTLNDTFISKSHTEQIEEEIEEIVNKHLESIKEKEKSIARKNKEEKLENQDKEDFIKIHNENAKNSQKVIGLLENINSKMGILIDLFKNKNIQKNLNNDLEDNKLNNKFNNKDGVKYEIKEENNDNKNNWC